MGRRAARVATGVILITPLEAAARLSLLASIDFSHTTAKFARKHSPIPRLLLFFAVSAAAHWFRLSSSLCLDSAAGFAPRKTI